MKHLVPLYVSNYVGAPGSVQPGYKKFYLKNGHFKLYDGANENDLVLDRPLDNFTNLSGTVTSSDTVLTALEKLQSSISSIVSSSYATISWVDANFVPNSRTITINGVSYDLSANRSWIIDSITDAPIDGITYGRKDGDWVEISPEETQDLQSVLDIGNTAVDRDIILNDSSGDRSAIYTDSGFYTSDSANSQENQVTYKSWYQKKANNKGWAFDTEVGIEFTFNENSIPTKITNPNSTESITLLVPDKPEGEYTIATTDDIIGANPTLDEVLDNGNTTDKTAIFLNTTKTTRVSPLSIFIGDENTEGTTISSNKIQFQKWGGGASANIVQNLILNTSQSNSCEPVYKLPAKTQDLIDYTLVTNDELNLNNVVMNGGNNTINTPIINWTGVNGEGYSTFAPGSLNISNLGAAYTNVIPGTIIFKQATGTAVRLTSPTTSASNVIYRLPLKTSGGTYDLVTSDTLGNYVPYTGATGNVNLEEYQLKAGQIEFDQTPTGTSGVAKLTWNDTDGTLDLGLKGGNVTLQLGQENVVRVVNKVGVNLLEANYQVVRVRTQAEGGAAGQRLAVKLAQADTKANHSGVLGLVTEDINNNQEGFITTFGNINKVNTTGSLQGETWNDGDDLWLSPTVAGGVTNIEPSVHPVKLGYVVYAHQNNGKIFVKVDEGVDQLDELHDVKISSATNGDVLTYNSSTQIWENKDSEYIKRQTQRVVETDFMVPSTASAVQFPYVFTLINSGALNSTTVTNGINPGILRLRSATAATPNSGAYLLPLGSSLTTGLTKIFSNAQIDFIFRTPGTLVGTGINLRFGLGQSASSTTDIDNGYYIEMIENSLYGKTADSSIRSQTSTSYTTAVLTWYHGRVKYISTSLVEYSLYSMDGTLLWSSTLTTNITTNSLNPLIIALSTNNAAGIDLVICDYFSATYPVSNRGALT
jgi:hypothetical protein